jgi:hypothetical protein
LALNLWTEIDEERALSSDTLILDSRMTIFPLLGGSMVGRRAAIFSLEKGIVCMGAHHLE